MTSICPVVPTEAITGIGLLQPVPAPSLRQNWLASMGLLPVPPGTPKRFLIVYAAVVDDPNAPFDPAAHHDMFIQTRPLALDGRYVIDKDCKVFVAVDTIRRGILSKLYPRETS